MSMSRGTLIQKRIHIPNVTEFASVLSRKIHMTGKHGPGFVCLDCNVHFDLTSQLVKHRHWCGKEQGQPLLSTNLNSATLRMEYIVSFWCSDVSMYLLMLD